MDIKIKGLQKIFGGKKIINKLDLTVNHGEKIAIIGPSGCGKSTLIRLIMRLQQHDAGSILINSKDIHDMDRDEIRKLRLSIGLVFQHSALFDSMTVGENVGFSLTENYGMSYSKINTIVKEKCSLVGLSGTENQMPSHLSGGMRKRVALARAIATDPEIILYDEPTTGLDPILSTQIEDLIVKLNSQLNCTSIVVSHQHSTILRTADKIYMMDNGALLAPESPHSIIKSKNPVIRKFIGGGHLDNEN